MFDHLTSTARTIVTGAQDEARARGAATIEAEHLLLALSHRPGDAAPALAAAGLDAGRLTGLLDQEQQRSLAGAGVEAPSAASAGRSDRRPGSLRLATSAKSVLERAVKESAQQRSRSIGERQLLVALLQAEAGTVPRMLALADVEPGTLIAALRERPAA